MRTAQIEPPTLEQYVEATVRFKLWVWQKILCAELSECATKKGIRLLIHAPPEFGKSSIVSTRFLAWLFGMNPLMKIGLACFNEGRAAEFGGIVAELMRADEFKSMFPDFGARIPDVTRADRFTTIARSGLVDTQVSFVALGMATGLISRGVDTLVLDDVYKSAEEAYSPVVNDGKWFWWERNALPRIDDETNVIVMFHRYHDTDLIGRIKAQDGLVQDGGKWKMLRFPAFGDENLDKTDPTGRKIGELLSPKQTLSASATIAWLNERKEKDPLTFMAQFQGDPSDARGLFFKATDFEIIDYEPVCISSARGWDVAFSLNSGDYTCGAKIGADANGNVIILDVWRDRVTGHQAQQMIVRLSINDGQTVVVGIEDSSNTKHLISILEQPEFMFRMPLQKASVWGRTKWERAQVYAGLVGRGKVKLLRGAWNHDFLKEHTRFRNKKTDTDDQIDAVVVALQVLGTSLGSIIGEQRPPVAHGTPEYYDRCAKDQNAGNNGTYWFD